MRRSVVASFAVASALLVASPALAQNAAPAPAATPTDPQAAAPAPAPAPPPPPDPALPAETKDKAPEDHSVAVTFSPIHLIFPVVEVMAEIRLHEKIGVAAIGGIGSMDPYQFNETARPPGLKTSRFAVWEVGGQFVSYPVGHFDHGMQLGAEILYAGVAGSAETSTESATGTGQGLSMGPFIGYKFTARVGFTLCLQGGVAYLTARAEAKSSTGQTASASNSQFGPLININLGWAF